MSQKVLGIAESINIMGKRSGTAMKERNQGPVQEMAKEGVGLPARKRALVA